MKRALSLIVVLAMVLAMIPAVFAADATEIHSFTNEAVGAENPYVYEGTATSAGTLHIAMEGTTWRFQVITDSTEYSPSSYSAYVEPTVDFEIAAGESYTVQFWSYANWSTQDGTVSGTISFIGGGAAEPVEKEFATYEPITATGTHAVTPLENTTWTMYIFEPTEIGKYTIAVDSGNTGFMGAGTFYTFVPASPAASFEQEITGVGQAVVFGVNAGATKVTITKSGESAGEQVVEYIPWENKHTPDASITIPSELEEVDITEKHTAVKISDSEYRLDSANGPIIYVDLEDGEWNMSEAIPGAFIVRAEYEGVHYNFRAPLEEYGSGKEEYQYGIAEYYDIMIANGGLYPLTTDLLAFIQGWGGSQGWFMSGLSWYEDINAGGFDADTAWMVACYTDPASVIPEAGSSAEDPIILLPGATGTIDHTTAAQTAGTPVYYAANRVQDYVLTVTGNGDFTVTFGSDVYTAENGVVTIDPFSAPDRYNPAIIAIDGNGTFQIGIAPPKGGWDNPDELKLGENSATLEAGSQGYYWTYTAPADGTLVFTVDAAANANGYSVVADNINTYKNITLDLDNGLTEGSLAISAGDTINVAANTMDLESYAAPAGTVTFHVELGHDCVDADGADYEYSDDYLSYDLVEICDICGEDISRVTWYMVYDQDDTTNDVEYTTVSVAPGESINLLANGVGGTVMTMAAGDSTVVIFGDTLIANADGMYTYDAFGYYGNEIVITNNGSAAATYELVFALPLGIYDNPETIVPGESYEQTFETADDAWNGYYYSFTADCAGTLVLDFAGETWSFVIEDANWNQTYGDNCMGDNGHVEIAMNAGDVITILLSSTIEDGTGWATGAAGTTGFTADFIHGTDGLEIILEAVANGDHSFGNIAIYSCEGCGGAFDAEGNPVDLESGDWMLLPNHIETMIEVEEVKATTETEGMKEHIHCTVCDKYFVLNEEALEELDVKNIVEEVTKDSLIIPKTETPNTGDNFALAAVITLMILSAMGVATVVTLKKRSII